MREHHGEQGARAGARAGGGSAGANVQDAGSYSGVGLLLRGERQAHCVRQLDGTQDERNDDALEEKAVGKRMTCNNDSLARFD